MMPTLGVSAPPPGRTAGFAPPPAGPYHSREPHREETHGDHAGLLPGRQVPAGGRAGLPLRHPGARAPPPRPPPALLREPQVVFLSGVNEDLGATAVFGSQLANLFPRPKYDGVLGMWYGKAPGVDRSGGIFKHANFAGVGRPGGGR